MAKNWALIIGINNYEFLQPLRYAKQDAEAVQDFLINKAEFEQVLCFMDNSQNVGGELTQPSYSNLVRVLNQVFKTPFMTEEDSFWFFFSGHGIRHQNRDYLMPLDGDPKNVAQTGISTTYVAEQLRRSGTGNVIMILDACRSENYNGGGGIGAETGAETRQTEGVTLFSCSSNQYSYEIDEIQQGAFTAALLEGLGIQGRNATLRRLNQYLQIRVPEIVGQYFKPAKQTPYIIAKPEKLTHLVLMPNYAGSSLRNDVDGAKNSKIMDLSEQLWSQGLAVAPEQNESVLNAPNAISDIEIKDSFSSKEEILSDLKQAWHEAMTGQTIPVSQLWDDLNND
ncbi:MAG: caspase family protein [Cyanobacteria bacterium P01_F01_bin.150]